MEESDRELLLKYRQGDRECLDMLVRRHRRQLFGFILNMTGNYGDAEDVFQEVWLKAIKKLDSYSDNSFKAWLIQIARNHIIDRWRSSRKMTSLDAETGESVGLSGRLAGSEPCPSHSVEQSELTGWVMDAVDDLPPQQKEVVLMRLEGELTFKEISEVLGISLGTALGRMHYAVAKLKKSLRKGYDEYS